MSAVAQEPELSAPTALDARRMRAALRAALPAEMFKPQPWRGVVALLHVPFMIGMVFVVSRGYLPWYGNLAIAFVLSQNLITVGFAAHEALHGSVFRSRFWNDVLGWVGFAPFLVSPGTWRAWHVQAHHGAANLRDRDPDILPFEAEYRRAWFARVLHRLSAGSGTLISFFSFLFFFTAQGQAFLWHHSRRPELSDIVMKRARERSLTVLLALGWLALGISMGWEASLYALVVPHLLGNVTLMIYIATNHWLQPASEQVDNPFINTASVSTLGVMDLVHWNFSYHQEHHIFPTMSPQFAPALREAVRHLDPAASIVYPHWAALVALYRRPPLYAEDGDGRVLQAPDGGRRVRTVDLRRELARRHGDLHPPPPGA